jgi:hypothetical protein
MSVSNEYHKIDTVFKRDPATNNKRLLLGEFSNPAFAFLARNTWVFTEKVDGTNIRLTFDPVNRKIWYGGRTDMAQIPAFLLQRLQEIFDPMADWLYESFPDGVVFYGEGYGAKIQKGGGNYRQDPGFVLFDIKVGDWWLERSNVEDIAGKHGLDVVPVIGRGDLTTMVERAAQGIGSQWGDFAAEGIVARPEVELKDRGGNRIITKIKTRDFADAKPASAS